MKKAIIFDFGGTLDTDGIHWSEKFWDVYCSIGVPFSKKEYETAYLYSEANVQSAIKQNDNIHSTLHNQVQLQIDYLIDKGFLSNKLRKELLEDAAGKCFTDVITAAKTARVVLGKIFKQYKLGLVSNFYGNLKTVLVDLSLDTYFGLIVDSHDVGIKKPDPKIFQLALDSLGVMANETFAIGDSYDRDITPAKQLGCTTIWLDVKSWKRTLNTSDADFIIKSIQEITEIVNNKNV